MDDPPRVHDCRCFEDSLGDFLCLILRKILWSSADHSLQVPSLHQFSDNVQIVFVFPGPIESGEVLLILHNISREFGTWEKKTNLIQCDQALNLIY